MEVPMYRISSVVVAARRDRTEVAIERLPQALGFGDIDVGQVRLVARGVVEEVVRRLVVMHEEEGFLAVPPLLQPIERAVGDRVR